MIYPDGTRMKGVWDKGKLVKEEKEKAQENEKVQEKENRDSFISN